MEDDLLPPHGFGDGHRVLEPSAAPMDSFVQLSRIDRAAPESPDHRALTSQGIGQIDSEKAAAAHDQASDAIKSRSIGSGGRHVYFPIRQGSNKRNPINLNKNCSQYSLIFQIYPN